MSVISSVDSSPLHVKPDIDLNLAIEANRIVYVLNKVIARAKIAGLLKVFSEDKEHLLRNIIDQNSHAHVVQACEKYKYMKRSSFSSTTDSSYELKSKDAETDESESADFEKEKETSDTNTVSSLSSMASTATLKGRDRERYDASLTEVIYSLEENPKVVELARRLENKLSPAMKYFLKCLTSFKERMEIRLHENAEQYKARESYMRETYDKNELAKAEISRLEEELNVTKTDANVCLIGRNILITRHENKIKKIQQTSHEAIEKRVNESEKAMVNQWKASSAVQEQLRADLQSEEEKYANLLKDHLAAEKVLRVKRAKVENQILGWIQKFDQDVGEKQAEEEEIQALLDVETDALKEIQNKIDEQEEEYDELMQEKAEYEEEMLERRLYHFIVNRSARRIQKSYRMYKARKLARKLAKKGKKGKKKAKK